MHELGLKGFDSTAWYGIVGPAGLPQEVVAKWTQVLAKAGTDKAVMDQISATGCDAEIQSPAATMDRVKSDYAKWGKVVKDANIRAD
jgi:tripartite-type tricarboxylate transporter receptor subunit TctC